jgi:cbb3-type cytochrome oxidase maturation protein
MDFEILGPYTVAMAMSLSGLCAFIWGVLSGAFTDSDQASLTFYRMEMENGRRHAPIAD